LLDTLEKRGVISTIPADCEKKNPAPEKDQRAKVVHEMLQTERKYVQDLEVMAKYQAEIQRATIFTQDTLHFLFPNLQQLLDFQRKFLVAVEYHASLPADEQRFGFLFEVSEKAFEVYEGYALSQKAACEIAMNENAKLLTVSTIIEPTYEFQAMLIKPIQRLCKYPLLVRELVKQTPEDWPYYDELIRGWDVIKRITNQVNETQRRVENMDVVKQLNERLRDWRGHNLEDFGELLHDGVFPVVKVGFEREYHLYLFENIILCCKEAAPSKKSMGLSKRNKSKRSSLVLKGRIYMAYITDVFVTKKDGYLLHISWGKDDASDTGFFDIRFRNEELLSQWETTVKKMVARYQESAGELFHTPFGDDDPLLINHTNYDDGSDDEYPDDLKVDTFDPSAESPSSSEPTSARTLSTSSVNNYFGYQSQPQQLTEEFNALGLATNGLAVRSREGSNVSLSNNAPPQVQAVHSSFRLQARNRSASTPNYPGGLVPGANQTHQFVPPMPSMYNVVPTGPANRIKSEGALPSAARLPARTTTNSHDSATSIMSNRSTTSFGSSTATTPISQVAGGFFLGAVKNPGHSNQLKVKLHYLEDTFLLIVPNGIQYPQLLERVDRKIRLCGKQTPTPLRIKYKDEDDDFITITSDEDIQMALEMRQEDSYETKNFNEILTIWVA
jgi:cell division control protein 24